MKPHLSHLSGVLQRFVRFILVTATGIVVAKIFQKINYGKKTLHMTMLIQVKLIVVNDSSIFFFVKRIFKAH